MSEREAIAQLFDQHDNWSDIVDRIIAEHLEPLRAGYGDVLERLSAALAKAEAERDMARKARAVYASESQRLLDCAEALEALLVEMRSELHGYQDAARYDATMEGAKFKHWDMSALNRARASTEARLKDDDAKLKARTS